MKRNELLIGAGILAVAAGSVAALADIAPVPVRKPTLPGIDVSISAIGVTTGGSLTTGTFGLFNAGSNGLPAGVFGLACGTTSCNQQPNNGPPTARFPAGNSGIVAGSPYFMGDWYAPFESGTNWEGQSLGTSAGDRHPYIAQAIYRVNAEGRLEQLGTSWFKHSWSAASGAMSGQVGTATGNDPCGIGSTCYNLNTDNQLEANCADTYSSSHNSDSYYMGPRSEVHPRKGINDPGWVRTKSYVDNYTSADVLAAGQGDGVRSLTGGSLKSWKMATAAYSDVSTAALGASGKVIMEGYYVVNGEGYKLNNVGHRQLNSSVAPGATSASISNFTLSGRHVWGPAVLQWGEQKSAAMPNTDGDVYVSSRAVSLGGGQWRYEYNVFNMDLAQNVNAFEVPVPSFANVTDINFRQPRQFVLNADGAAWTSTYDSTKKAIVWSAPAAPVLTNEQRAAMVPPLRASTEADPNTYQPNNIVWGTMYTFWFTCDLDPRSDVASKITPGSATSFNTQMAAEARGPRHPADLGRQGGEPGADGLLDNNDFIKFIDYFFAMDPLADVGVQGGLPGHDALYDNNDFIAFIDFFFMS